MIMSVIRSVSIKLLCISIGFSLMQHILSQSTQLLQDNWCDTLPVLKIGLIADPQYCNCDPSGDRYYREVLSKLPKAIDSLNKYQVDFVMNLGDMIDRYEDSYDSVIQYYQALNVPYYNLLGNHAFSEVSEHYLDSILIRYEMPDFYYDFSYQNWRFIVLDGTELAEYSRYLHPELADEGDSLWQKVQGKINALPWNGGIGRIQQSWLRSKLQEALDSEQNVILFCHIPVYPDSMRLGLWNDSSIVSILEDYPNVVAYINGHEHTGDYGYKNGIHYYTQKAMVDFPDKNSFSILEIFLHKIRLKGFGNITDTVFTYSDIKKKPLIFDLTDSTLHYSDYSNSYTGKFIPDAAQGYSQVDYTIDPSSYENRYFAIRNDSLFLDTDEDISYIPDIRIEIVASGCEFDTTSHLFQITFDTASASFHYSLTDTLLSVYDPYLILLDSFVTDHSRLGLVYTPVTSDSSVILVTVTDTSLLMTPKKAGNSVIELYVTDAYLDKTYLHRFSIHVYDPFNHPPIVNELSDTTYYIVLYDTLTIDLNKIFTDPDDDDLSFGFLLHDTINFSGNLTDSVLSVYAGSSGRTECEITADDSRGGILTQVLELVVNHNPVRIGDYTEYVSSFGESMCLSIDLDTIFADPDVDTLVYLISDSDFPAVSTGDGLMEICPVTAGTGIIWLEITDNKNGLLIDSITIQFKSEAVSLETLSPERYPVIGTIYPNPSEGSVYILLYKVYYSKIKLTLSDLSGRMLQEVFVDNDPGEEFHFTLNIDENITNGIYLLGITSPESQPLIHRIILLR